MIEWYNDPLMENENELLTKLDGLFSLAITQREIRNGILDLETRKGILGESGFNEEEIEKMMPIEAESLSDFAVKIFEAFSLPFSPGKERKEGNLFHPPF